MSCNALACIVSQERDVLWGVFYLPQLGDELLILNHWNSESVLLGFWVLDILYQCPFMLEKCNCPNVVVIPYHISNLSMWHLFAVEINEIQYYWRLYFLYMVPLPLCSHPLCLGSSPYLNSPLFSFCLDVEVTLCPSLTQKGYSEFVTRPW